MKSLSHVRLFATPWAVAYQASLSMGPSRKEYWSVLPFPSPGDLPNPGIKPGSPALQADALTSEPVPSCICETKVFWIRISLAVQWLGRCFHCWGWGVGVCRKSPVPGWGARIPHISWQDKKKKNNWNKKFFWNSIYHWYLLFFLVFSVSFESISL